MRQALPHESKILPCESLLLNVRGILVSDAALAKQALLFSADRDLGMQHIQDSEYGLEYLLRGHD